MKRVWNAGFARLVDRLASQTYGVSEDALMAAAAQKIAKTARALSSDNAVLIALVGRGNNGGDTLLSIPVLGLPLERLRVFTFFDGGALSPACERALLSVKARYPTLAITPYKEGALADYAETPSIIIDGIYGLGFHAPLTDKLVMAAFRDTKALRKATVIAVDLTSGLEADTFDTAVDGLKAHHSLSFGGLKPAQVMSPARFQSGHVEVVDIGFPPAALQEATVQDPGLLYLIENHDIPTEPWRTLAQSAHKFDRGHTLVIGGSEGKLGAPVLSAMAALRAGCGWSSVAIPTDLEPHFPPLPLELTFERFFCANKIDTVALSQFVKTRSVSAIVVGPGTTEQPLHDGALEALIELSHQQVKIIVDAAATKGLFSMLARCKAKPNPAFFLLTPHPGEWLKLPENPPRRYQDLEGILAKANTLGVTLIYKGASPLVFFDKKVVVHNENSNALAKAGTGDVFAGLCAGYAKCFLTVNDCANQSFMALARAVDILTHRRDTHSILPTDIINAIGALD